MHYARDGSSFHIDGIELDSRYHYRRDDGEWRRVGISLRLVGLILKRAESTSSSMDDMWRTETDANKTVCECTLLFNAAEPKLLLP